MVFPWPGHTMEWIPLNVSLGRSRLVSTSHLPSLLSFLSCWCMCMHPVGEPISFATASRTGRRGYEDFRYAQVSEHLSDDTRMSATG
jgi:hypothetical protein